MRFDGLLAVSVPAETSVRNCALCPTSPGVPVITLPVPDIIGISDLCFSHYSIIRLLICGLNKTAFGNDLKATADTECSSHAVGE